MAIWKPKKSLQRESADYNLVEHHLIDMKTILDISLTPLVATNRAAKLWHLHGDAVWSRLKSFFQSISTDGIRHLNSCLKRESRSASLLVSYSPFLKLFLTSHLLRILLEYQNGMRNISPYKNQQSTREQALAPYSKFLFTVKPLRVCTRNCNANFYLADSVLQDRQLVLLPCILLQAC